MFLEHLPIPLPTDLDGVMESHALVKRAEENALAPTVGGGLVCEHCQGAVLRDPKQRCPKCGWSESTSYDY